MEVLTADTRRPSLHSRPWATTSQRITSTVRPRMSREAPSSIRTSSADIVSAQFQLFRIRLRVSIIANVVPNTHHQLTQSESSESFLSKRMFNPQTFESHFNIFFVCLVCGETNKT